MLREILTVLAALSCVAAATAAPYTGPWTHEWTFDAGPQGWTLAGPEASWVNPATHPNGPTLTDDTPSGAGAANLWLPSGSRALLNVVGWNLGNSLSGQNGFVLQADIYVPNLRPRAGTLFAYDLPGNAFDQAGIAAVMADGSGAFVEGFMGGQVHSGGKGQTRARDNTAGNQTWRAATNYEFYQPGDTGYPYDAGWWDDWVTVQLDYSYQVPGKYSAWVYIPWLTAAAQPGTTPGWLPITPGAFDCGAAAAFQQFMLGGANSYTQAQWDNVKLVYVPDPATVLGLGFGVLLLRRCR